VSKPPPWDSKIWAEQNPKFDFANGQWTSDGSLFQLRSRDESPWLMPPVTVWADDAPKPEPKTLESIIFRSPLILCSLIGALVFAGLGAWFGGLAGSALSLTFLVFVFATVIGAIIDAVATENKDRETALLQVENELDESVYPVIVEVIQSGVPTGKDAGVAWIDEDALYFAGKISSFVIGRCDVHPIPAWRLEERVSRMGMSGLVFLQHPNRTVALHFVDAISLGETYKTTSRRFSEELRAFKHSGSGPGDRSYPPLAVLPSMVVDRIRVGNRPLVTALGTAYFALVGYWAGVTPWLAVLIGLIAALMIPIFCQENADPKVRRLRKALEEEDRASL
jgi:hypothetical protein